MTQTEKLIAEARELCERADNSLMKISGHRLTDPCISVSLYNQLSNTHAIEPDLRTLVSRCNRLIPALCDALEQAQATLEQTWEWDMYQCAYCGAEFIIQEIPPHKHLIAGLPDYEGSWYAECSGCTCSLTAPTKKQLMEALTRRPEPEHKPLTLHFGDGKIGVSTCRTEDSEVWNELLLWNPHMQQAIGNQIPIGDGTTTDDVEVYARLFFHNPESAQVVVDALNRIIAAYDRPPREDKNDDYRNHSS